MSGCCGWSAGALAASHAACGARRGIHHACAPPAARSLPAHPHPAPRDAAITEPPPGTVTEASRGGRVEQLVRRHFAPEPGGHSDVALARRDVVPHEPPNTDER